MHFYLGTHEPSWLGRLSVPLFVSHRRLMRLGRLPKARAPWALDSGGFTELHLHGRWVTEVDEYVEAVDRYRQQIGHLDWAAPMDWMCEPSVLAQTGLSVRHHQQRTVENYLQLKDLGPFIPVLQGWSYADYERCVDLYAQAGVDLRSQPLVGVGSVCRRQAMEEVGRIAYRLGAVKGISLHGFGIKKQGVRQYGRHLASSDSMAWSYRARRDKPLAGCSHASCQNCADYALRWRQQLLDGVI